VLFAHLVLVLAEIHHPANRGNGSRRYLDKIIPFFAGHPERLCRGHDAELGAFFVDDSNLSGPYAFVYPDILAYAATSILK